MNFKPFFELKNKHAFFSPSKHTWIRWDREKIENAWRNFKAAERGTELHEYAEKAIKLGRRQADKDSVGMYINDAIEYRMKTEVALYYSDNCFGHADALCFRRKKLRIFDLKTGLVTPGSMDQLLIYAALYCFTYDVDPRSIKYDLRIYQFDQAICYEPTGEEIAEIMDIIVENDAIVEMLKGEIENE